MFCANVVPCATSPIPWGWKNETIDCDVAGLPKKLTRVREPLGEIKMPDLVSHFDWSRFTVEDFSSAKPFGTQNFKSIFTTASRFLGYERLLAEMPSLHRITDAFLEWNWHLIRSWHGRLEHFLIGDDIAGNDSLFLSPDDFRQWLLPQYLRLLDLAHANGIKSVGFHSDGDIMSIMPDLACAGFSFVSYQPIGEMAGFLSREQDTYLGMRLFLVEDQARENDETLRLQR